MKDIIDSNGEEYLGKWTINCIPFGAGRSLGNLYVSNKAFYYEANYDMSLEGIFEQVAVSAVSAAGHALLVSPEICKQWKSKGYLHVLKSDISGLEMKSSFLKKKLIVTLKDEQQIVFDYGMLSVKKLKAAIESQ